LHSSQDGSDIVVDRSDFNETQTGEWRDVTRPELIGMKDKWAQLDIATAEDETLLQAIEEMAVAEGYYCERSRPLGSQATRLLTPRCRCSGTSNASHTFGVAKSTDDHLQCFREPAKPLDQSSLLAPRAAD